MYNATELRTLALEHLMRCIDDATSLLPLVDAEPTDEATHAALGRVLGRGAVAMPAGSPLLVWLTGSGKLDPNWRDTVGSKETSLWSQFDFLELMAGKVSWPGRVVEHPLHYAANPVSALLLLEERYSRETDGGDEGILDMTTFDYGGPKLG